MKFFKMLFSRASLITFLILFQIFLIVEIVLNFNQNFWIFVSFFLLLEFFVYIRISNRNINPSQKILWITLVIGVPVIGVCLYLILGGSKYGPHKKKNFRQIVEKYKNFVFQNELPSKEYANQSNYIFNTTFYPIYSNTNTKYFSDGASYLSNLQKDLLLAKKFIFLEFFTIEKGKMWDSIFKILKEKSKNGVEVKIIYDDLGTINRLPNDFNKKMEKENGIKCVKFNRYNPFITIAHNNRDHRKIVVIDGKIAYTGGINIADNYINLAKKKLTWKDGAERIEGEAVKNFVLMFLQSFEIYGKPVNIKSFLIDYKKSSEGFVQPFATGPLPFYKDTYALNIVLNMINQAKKSLYISTPYLIPDYQVLNALIIAKKRGVDIKIVIPDIPDKKLPYLMTKTNSVKLMQHGIEIFKYKKAFIHTKSILADNEIGLIGTINFDYRSFVHNFECAIWQYKTKALEELNLDFEDMFLKFKPSKEKDFKINWFKKTIANILNILSPIF